jgi:hypothetical protein
MMPLTQAFNSEIAALELDVYLSEQSLFLGCWRNHVVGEDSPFNSRIIRDLRWLVLNKI